MSGQAIAGRVRRPLREFTACVWPSAAFVPLPLAPHPETIHYAAGAPHLAAPRYSPTPYIELRQTGTLIVYRVYVGQTFQIPYNGLNGWEVRAATRADDALLSAVATPVTLILNLLLDVPIGTVSPSLIVLDSAFTTASTDPATRFVNVSTEGALAVQFVSEVTVFAAGATTQLTGHSLLAGLTPSASAIGAVMAALADRRVCAWSMGWGYTPVNFYTIAPGGNPGLNLADALGMDSDGAVAALTFAWGLRGILGLGLS